MKDMGKNKVKIKNWVTEFSISVILCLGIGGSLSMVLENQDKAMLRNRLETKVERIADVNSNGLDIKEMSKVYKKIGLNPIDELRRRGFKLSVDEMQKYLNKMGRFDPKTDTYHQ